MSLTDRKQAVEHLESAFNQNITCGFLDRLPLSLIGNEYLEKIFPNYERPEGQDFIISALLWVALMVVAAHISGWLIFAVVLACVARIIDFRRKFVQVMRNHPTEVAIIASHWCDLPDDRQEEMKAILKFTQHKPVTTNNAKRAFVQLFVDINEEMSVDLTDEYKSQFCQDCCELEKTDSDSSI